MPKHQYLILLSADSRVLLRDPLLAWIVLLPFTYALLIRLLVPAVQAALISANGFDLTPYYPLIMGGFVMTAPAIVGMVIGFLILDERDAGTLLALRVTPLPAASYLAYRLTLPLLVGMVATIVGYPIAGLTPLPLATLAPIAAVGALFAPLLALILATVAPNKIAGFATMKVVGSTNLLPTAAFFIPMPLQLLAGLIPSYWPMRALWSVAAGEPFTTWLIFGIAANTVALLLAARAFQRRLLRYG